VTNVITVSIHSNTLKLLMHVVVHVQAFKSSLVSHERPQGGYRAFFWVQNPISHQQQILQHIREHPPNLFLFHSWRSVDTKHRFDTRRHHRTGHAIPNHFQGQHQGSQRNIKRQPSNAMILSKCNTYKNIQSENTHLSELSDP
jgi:hypothetical protein